MIEFTSTGLRAFGLSVHWYGVIIAAGMALAVALAVHREKRPRVLEIALQRIRG